MSSLWSLTILPTNNQISTKNDLYALFLIVFLCFFWSVFLFFCNILLYSFFLFSLSLCVLMSKHLKHFHSISIISFFCRDFVTRSRLTRFNLASASFINILSFFFKSYSSPLNYAGRFNILNESHCLIQSNPLNITQWLSWAHTQSTYLLMQKKDHRKKNLITI